MLEWLFEWLFKPYIDKLVDRRIKENMFERYWQQKNEETRQRIEKLRRNLNSSTPSPPSKNPSEAESLSGGYVYSRQNKPEVQTSSDQAAMRKREEMDKIRAKLKRQK
jgi:hypothetical protein